MIFFVLFISVWVVYAKLSDCCLSWMKKAEQGVNQPPLELHMDFRDSGAHYIQRTTTASNVSQDL